MTVAEKLGFKDVPMISKGATHQDRIITISVYEKPVVDNNISYFTICYVQDLNEKSKVYFIEMYPIVATKEQMAETIDKFRKDYLSFNNQ